MTWATQLRGTATASALFAGLFAMPVHAIDTYQALIDSELRNQVDFRRAVFGACLNQVICSVEGVTATAERRDRHGVWHAATIYWDPIDGFGVMGGQQNDEIDIDERLTLTFDTTQNVTGIWLSDLFIGEGARYLGWPASNEDVEIADIGLRLDDQQLGQFRVSGVFELPDNPFNAVVNDIFSENGDLLNRVIVEGAAVSVMEPDETQQKGVIRPLTAMQAAQIANATDTEALDASIAALLQEEENLRTFNGGDTNADRIVAIHQEIDRLDALRIQAEGQRLIGDVSNGELRWQPGQTFVSNRIVFTAGYQTSSDYSVAGVLVLGGSE